MNRKSTILVFGVAFVSGGIFLLIKAFEANVGQINKDGPTWHGPVGWTLLGLGFVSFVIAALMNE
jgi:hypothetical protein